MTDPGSSRTVITIDVLVIDALTVRGGRRRDSTR
jgi:hypothetical protein